MSAPFSSTCGEVRDWISYTNLNEIDNDEYVTIMATNCCNSVYVICDNGIPEELVLDGLPVSGDLTGSMLPSTLLHIGAYSTKLTGHIGVLPRFLQILDFEYTSISGPMPFLPDDISAVYLTETLLEGHFPTLPQGLQYLWV